jgi:EAL domain-containing protein (putative c-di-GMP-specific phosphodiesterase class I)
VINDIEILVSATIGVAWPSKRILEHAVQAVKEAKESRKRIQIYENIPYRHDYSRNISWYKRIKSAIDESRFMPYFHPIIDNKTKKIIKYEALIRLMDEDGNVIEPHHFLGMSKKMRMYSQLTAIMVEKVCEIFSAKNVPVSVNLSIEDLLNNELVNKVEKIILHYQMGSRIEFEILETENIENYEEAKMFIERFRALGCRFAIDDFGAGYSNFDQVLKLNVDTIKIDGSLIKNLQHDKNARIFVHHIADLARELGIKTVAEFVSNEDIYNLVNGLGIDASQGYYFYEPSNGFYEEAEM